MKELLVTDKTEVENSTFGIEPGTNEWTTKTGIKAVVMETETQPQAPIGLTIKGNRFTDLSTAIRLSRWENDDPNAEIQGEVGYDFTLRCNEFINEAQTGPSPVTRRGLVIGEGVRLRAPGVNGTTPDNIGGSESYDQNNPNVAYPNANVWPTPDFDEGIPNSGFPNFIPSDVNASWANSPNWVSIENLNSIGITYHRFFNEFVGKGFALVNTILPEVTYNNNESVITQANTSVNPLLTTVQACSLLVDPNPVLFPARIAIIGHDSTKTSVTFQKMGMGLELSDPIPNPASVRVSILAKIPFPYEKAILQIIQTGTGKVLQNVDLDHGSNLEITLDVEKSPSGTYQYRLIVDGNPSKPKTLVVTH